jgi:hypothetical protein
MLDLPVESGQMTPELARPELYARIHQQNAVKTP